MGVTDESFYKRGDAIEQYTITGVLDAKSGIDIYLAKDNSNDSLCVIKLLNCSRTSNANDREKGSAMLEREYLLLQKAASAPSIAKAFVFANDQHGNPYLVQEFIKGKPICEFIEETKTWTENDSLLLLKNLVNAFAQLHQCGIVHGDVHSSNVLVARDKTVRVIDLGMSLQQAEIDKAQTTRHGGVYEYMPPERIGRSSTNKFTKAPDFRSDVYQIGLLLYFLLYHNLPFKGFVWEDLSAAIQEGAASFPNTAAAGFSIPVGLRRLVQKCMATDPQNRYADATEIVTACNQYLLTENHAPLYA